MFAGWFFFVIPILVAALIPASRSTRYQSSEIVDKKDTGLFPTGSNLRNDRSNADVRKTAVRNHVEKR
jgi:hypothetical protein